MTQEAADPEIKRDSPVQEGEEEEGEGERRDFGQINQIVVQRFSELR